MASQNFPAFPAFAGDAKTGAQETIAEIRSVDIVPPINDRLKAGDCLRRGGQSIKSANGIFSLVFQEDGNLVIYQGTDTIWSTGTNEWPEPYRCQLEADGNLCLYEDDRPKWSSKTGGHAGENLELILLNNGNLVLCNPDNRLIWQTATSRPDFVANLQPSWPVKLGAGQNLVAGARIVSPNGKYWATFGSGLSLQKDSDGSVIWSSGDGAGSMAERAVLRDNGELCTLNWNDEVKWSSGTAGKGDNTASLSIKDDGNMTLESGGQVIWQTNSQQEGSDSGKLTAGQTRDRGRDLISPNGRYRLGVYNSELRLRDGDQDL